MTVERTDPPRIGGEREMLEGWLEYHRATLLRKCSGLTDAQMRQASCPPSNLTLLGLVRHMTDVERAGSVEASAARMSPSGSTSTPTQRPTSRISRVPM